MARPPIRQLQSTVEEWTQVVIHHSCSAGNNVLCSVGLAGGPLSGLMHFHQRESSRRLAPLIIVKDGTLLRLQKIARTAGRNLKFGIGMPGMARRATQKLLSPAGDLGLGPKPPSSFRPMDIAIYNARRVTGLTSVCHPETGVSSDVPLITANLGIGAILLTQIVPKNAPNAGMPVKCCHTTNSRVNSVTPK